MPSHLQTPCTSAWTAQKRLFIKGNYLLLAQKYNIQAQKAQEIQAKLYPNPNLSVYYSLYNTVTKKFFPTGPGTTGR